MATPTTKTRMQEALDDTTSRFASDLITVIHPGTVAVLDRLANRKT